MHLQDPTPTEPAVEGADMSWLDAAFMGLVEGVTEFLPVSSTGHLIVAGDLIGGSSQAFEIAIQVGAITAILVLYGRRLWQSFTELFQRTENRTEDGRGQPNLFVLLFVGALPAGIAGLLLDDFMEEWLFSSKVVAIALVVGGVALLWLERWQERQAEAGAPVEDDVARMSLRQAFTIGLFQCLALVPGTSRSGSTIAGGLLAGMSRTAAAEFSFLVGLPILYGACGLKLIKDWEALTGPMLPAVLVATAVSFVSALVVVVPFVRFLRRHTFRPFAWYRIVAGAAIGALAWSGWLSV